MPSVRLACRALLSSAFAAALCAAALPAHADTYSIASLTIDNKSFYGMDDSGNVVFSAAFGCSAANCYYSYRNGSSQGISSTAPFLNNDFGSGLCNGIASDICSATDNGRTVTASQVAGSLDDLYLYTAGNAPQLIAELNGIAGKLVINGQGDILFDNGSGDEWYEAFDVSATPEPASLLLLATGALVLAAFIMRRRFMPSA